MKKLIIFFALMIIGLNAGFCQVSKDHLSVVLKFIEQVKMNKKDAIANSIKYPFNREYPIPSIKNKQDFIKRYNEIFDDKLIKMIISSNPSTDWNEMGWRGIMLNNGDLWLDYDGRLISVNHQSDFEKDLREKLIESERNKLHISIRSYKRPVLILETKKFRIRIDDLGNNIYRYASWGISTSMSDEPDLIISRGKLIPEGSGGNHRFEFRNGDYMYECSIIVLGEDDSPPAILAVYNKDKEILSQSANIIVK